MRINTLLDMISKTHIAAGGLRVGDFVKNKKTGAQGVVILAKNTSGKIKAKAKVWLSNGKVAMFQNVQNYQKIGTPSMFSVDVLNEDENTFQIELANVIGEDESKSEESESEDSDDSDFSVDSPPQASPGQDSDDSDFSVDSPPQASPGQDSDDSDFSVDSPPQASPGQNSVERNSEDVDFLSAVQNIQNQVSRDWSAESEKIQEYFTVPTDGEEKVADLDESYDASYMSDASEEKVNDTRLSLSRNTSIADSDEDYEASYFSCLTNLEQTRAMAQAIAHRAYQMGQLQNQIAVRNAALIEDE